ncbi:MAG: hypothetical protein K0B14_13405 [Anaerolineaceae bacterium]|nr:hypothetical protein [Anaerolineaceae bacterium]
MINQLLENFFNTIPNTVSILIVLGLAIITLFLSILFSFLLIRSILRIQWKSQTVKKFLRIKNEGNVLENYFIKIIIPLEDLKFECFLDGNRLPDAPPVKVAKAATTSEDNKRFTPSYAAHNSSKSSSVSKTAVPDQNDKKKLADSVDALQKKSKKGTSFIRLVSGIIGTLGSLLPGSVGRSLKQKSTEMQKSMQAVDNKMQMPEQKLKSMDHLKGQVGQLDPGAKDSKPASNQSVSASPNDDIKGSTPSHIAEFNEKNSSEEHSVISTGYLQTPPLAPDQDHILKVLLDPLHHYRSGEYSLEVLVRQGHPEKAFTDLSEKKELGKVFIKGLSPIFWVLSFLMVLCVVVINATWAVLLINWMANFVL